MWKHPYGRLAQRSKKFKRFCWRNGYVSPHFTRDEWASKDGTAVPISLKANAQRQAFKCELLRHRLGDQPIAAISYYRSPAHNAAVGGASQSRHMQADACDWSVETIGRFGRSRFEAAINKIWANNGIGHYPSGSAHTDARPYRARW
jgi:zinc D-Ala-D-Ala carboxypeptidase